jgi:hypothetical protein
MGSSLAGCVGMIELSVEEGCRLPNEDCEQAQRIRAIRARTVFLMGRQGFFKV